MTESSNIPTFRVGDAFPSDNDKKASLVRFLIAAQTLPAITRIIPVLPESDVFRESKHYLMLLSLGTAHEAAEAFWGALQHGVLHRDLFAPISSADLSEIDECISRLTFECDRSRPDSLESKLVIYCRHKLSFHWDKEVVRKSLAQVEDELIPAWRGGDNFMTTALPIVELVTLKGLEIRLGSAHELEELVGRVARFQVDLARVAEAAYSAALRVALKGKRGSGGILSGAWHGRSRG